jgi:hypothetical protein
LKGFQDLPTIVIGYISGYFLSGVMRYEQRYVIQGLGLRLHGRTWWAQRRIRKSCIDAYPDGGPVLHLNTGRTDKKEAASVARQ